MTTKTDTKGRERLRTVLARYTGQESLSDEELDKLLADSDDTDYMRSYIIALVDGMDSAENAASSLDYDADLFRDLAERLRELEEDGAETS